MKLRVHANDLRLLSVLDKELPTLDTPLRAIEPFFRRVVLPRLDFNKKWTGCWMWEGATTKEGEPKIAVRDNFTKNERGTGLGRAQQPMVKREIAKRFIDTRKLPRRRLNGQTIQEPDFDVVHLCGNLGCLNPEHLIVCLDDAKQRDVTKLRDKYLAPGKYYVE